MSEKQMYISIAGSDEVIELQYDSGSRFLFTTYYDQDEFPIRRRVTPMQKNPIPIIKHELEREIKRYERNIESDIELD